MSVPGSSVVSGSTGSSSPTKVKRTLADVGVAAEAIGDDPCGDIDAIVEAVHRQLQPLLAQEASDSISNVSSTIGSAITAYDKKMESRLQPLEQGLATLQVGHERMATQQHEIWDAVRKLEQSVAQAESQVPSLPAPDDRWDRPEDPIIIRVSCPEEISRDAAGVAVRQLLLDAQIDLAQVRIEGTADVSRRRIIKFTGEVGLAQRRVNKALGAMRISPANGESSLQKRPMGKMLRSMWAEINTYAAYDAKPVRVGFGEPWQRFGSPPKTTSASSRKISLLQSSDGEWPKSILSLQTLHPGFFNNAAAAELGFDREAIQQKFEEMAPSVEDISWG